MPEELKYCFPCLVMGCIFFFGGLFGSVFGAYTDLWTRITTSIFGIVVGFPLMVIGFIWTLVNLCSMVPQ